MCDGEKSYIHAKSADPCAHSLRLISDIYAFCSAMPWDIWGETMLRVGHKKNKNETVFSMVSSSIGWGSVGCLRLET
jgi:hypothetical protein